ncbi:FHA domain-containing protein [Cystobacter fuscus]|uniref:FHA domain-containing protein n=1 Tax=Cystobacter fuscus TaxID=43 RepID=UPI0037C196A0
MPRLIYLESSTARLETHVIPLHPETTLCLGRHAEVDVTIFHSHVAGRHCRLRHEAGRVWLMDLGSTNGTFLIRQGAEPRRLWGNESILLEPGDEFLLAEVARFRFEGPAGVEPPPPPAFSLLGGVQTRLAVDRVLVLQYREPIEHPALLLHWEVLGPGEQVEEGEIELCREEPPAESVQGTRLLSYLSRRFAEHPLSGLLQHTTRLYQRACEELPALEVATEAARSLCLGGLAAALTAAPDSPRRAHIARAGSLSALALRVLGQAPRGVLFPSLWGGPLPRFDAPRLDSTAGSGADLALQLDRHLRSLLGLISERVEHLLQLPEEELLQRFKPDSHRSGPEALSTLLDCARSSVALSVRVRD